MSNNRIDLIRQALGAAESSIKLAKQLLSELEGGVGHTSRGDSNRGGREQNGKVYPGVMGIFDGENMVTDSGESFPVPVNYASKSLLVVGDTLKLVEEGAGKEKRFKQIEHVKRHRTIGIIAKKDGKWRIVTPEGSYKVLGGVIEHLGAAVGDEVVLHLPAGNLTVPYGAIESVKGKQKQVEEPQHKPAEAVVETTKTPSEKPVEAKKDPPKDEEKKESPQEKAPEKKTETKPPVVEKAIETPKVDVRKEVPAVSAETPKKLAPKAPEVSKSEPKPEPSLPPPAIAAPKAEPAAAPVLTEEDELT